ncbi:MAG: outer membrane beta-barrel protein [Saprospiraceae bacterium]
MLRKHMLLLAALCLFFTVPAFSQLKLGLKVGGSSTEIDASDFQVGNQLDVALDDVNFGIHGGLVIRAQLGSFLIQPEVLFSSNSVDYRVDDLTNNLFDQIKEEKFQYLNIPVLLGYKFGPLRLMAGPQGHIFINNSSELTDFANYDEKFKSMTLSWLGGVGLDLWSLMLDVRYEGNFNKFGEHIRFGDQQFDFADRPSRWTFSVGFLF